MNDRRWRLARGGGRAAALAAAGIAGCVAADLTKVHSADLQNIPPKVAARVGPGVLTMDYAADVPPSAEWELHSSFADQDAMRDYDPGTTAASEPGADQFVLLDFGRLASFQSAVQLHPIGAPAPAFRYRIDTAGEKGFPYKLRYVGEGGGLVSVAVLKDRVRCRFVRITRLLPAAEAAAAPRWAIAELQFP